MNIRLRVLQAWFPRSLKKKRLRDLYALTADAFRKETPALRELSWEACLRDYALFTKTEAERVLRQGGDVAGLEQRLYGRALALGRRLRDQLHVRTAKEAEQALRLIYSAIKIDLEAKDGEVVISRCFFSDHYSLDVCRLIASLDEGVAAGLTEGGRLEISQRITEGQECCRGRLVFAEKQR
jgi:hypothetical protein